MVLESCHSPLDSLQMEVESVSPSFCSLPLMPETFLTPMLALWTCILGMAEGDPKSPAPQKKQHSSALRFERFKVLHILCVTLYGEVI